MAKVWPVRNGTGVWEPTDRSSTRTSTAGPVTATVHDDAARTTSPPNTDSMPAADSSLPAKRFASRKAPASSAPDGATPRWAEPGALDAGALRLAHKSEEHTPELHTPHDPVCRLALVNKKRFR